MAGKNQNQYKNLTGLQELLVRMAKEHSYTKRFETFLARASKKASPGIKKRRRALALKVVHAMDGKGTIRRDDLVQDLLAANYKRKEIDQMIQSMHRGGLIQSLQGRYSKVTIV